MVGNHYHCYHNQVKSTSFAEVSVIGKSKDRLLNAPLGPPCQGFSQANRHPVSQVTSHHSIGT